MFTRLAYAFLGKPAPQGDLYAIPGLEGFRSGVKLAMNVFLFDNSAGRRKWPDEMGIGVGSDAEPESDEEYTGRLPLEYGVAKTKEAILKLHPELKAAWGKSLGYYLMFLESQILLDVLLKLVEKGIVALPLHDGIIISESHRETGKEVMLEVAKEISGIDIPVTQK